jgi:hypothetical protein
MNQEVKDITPKEKAQDLYNVFIDKQTAIMFVDGVINGDGIIFTGAEEWLDELDYWHLVKHELEKL